MVWAVLRASSGWQGASAGAANVRGYGGQERGTDSDYAEAALPIRVRAVAIVGGRLRSRKLALGQVPARPGTLL